MSQEIKNKRKRLIFRSEHRGTKEMDLLMGSFARKFVPSLSEAELSEYEALLHCNDPDLYNWIVGTEDIPANIDGDLFQKIKAHKFS